MEHTHNQPHALTAPPTAARRCCLCRYTSLPLMAALWARYKCYLVGTTRLTTKASRTKDDFAFKKLSGGAAGDLKGGWLRWAYRKMFVGGKWVYTVMAVVWKDKKICAFLSNKFVGPPSEDAAVERRRKGESERKTIPAHEVVQAYVRGYRWVDAADRGMSDWTVARASRRWYMVIVYYLINVVVWNVWIIVGFWDKSTTADADAYINSDSSHHGHRMSFQMRLARSLVNHAVQMELAENGEATWVPRATRDAHKAGSAGILTTPAGVPGPVVRRPSG